MKAKLTQNKRQAIFALVVLVIASVIVMLLYQSVSSRQATPNEPGEPTGSENFTGEVRPSESVGTCSVRFYSERNYGGSPYVLSGESIDGVRGMVDLRLYKSVHVDSNSDGILICNPAHAADETRCHIVASGESIAHIQERFGATYETPAPAHTVIGCPADRCVFDGAFSAGGEVRSNLRCIRNNGSHGGTHVPFSFPPLHAPSGM